MACYLIATVHTFVRNCDTKITDIYKTVANKAKELDHQWKINYFSFIMIVTIILESIADQTLLLIKSIDYPELQYIHILENSAMYLVHVITCISYLCISSDTIRETNQNPVINNSDTIRETNQNSAINNSNTIRETNQNPVINSDTIRETNHISVITDSNTIQENNQSPVINDSHTIQEANQNPVINDSHIATYKPNSPQADIETGEYVEYETKFMMKRDWSEILLPAHNLSGNNWSSSHFTSYKRDNDTTKRIPIPLHWWPPSPKSYTLGTTITTGRPTAKELRLLAKEIGKEWIFLAFELGISQAQMDQFQMSYPNNPLMYIFTMLQNWRESVQNESEDERIQLLKEALHSIDKNDLAMSLEQTTNLKTE